MFAVTRDLLVSKVAYADWELVWIAVMSFVCLFAFTTSTVITKLADFFKDQLRAWLYLTRGAEFIQDAYFKSKDGPFKIRGPDNDHVFVSSKQHIKELLAARWYELSFFAATKHMFQPKYTMHGHNWLDERGAEGIGYVKAVGILLPRKIAKIGPKMHSLIQETFDTAFTKVPRNSDGSRTMHAYVVVKHIICRLNAYCFYGDELAGNEAFMEKVYEYNEIVITGAEVLRLTPQFLKPFIGPFIAKRNGVQEFVFNSINNAVEKRLTRKAETKSDGTDIGQPNDMIQWIIDTAPRKAEWTSHRITYEILALWFGASHALAATSTYALYDLCMNKEYIPILRREVENPEEFADFLETTKGMPLLDSFMKESTRLSPMEAMSGRRQALNDFKFGDGTVVKKGDWTCVPTKAIQYDPRYFPRPMEFHGFRFLNPELAPSDLKEVFQPDGPSKLTDPSPNYYYWGLGKIVCPGRFYVSVASKLFIAHLLRHFDCDLQDRDEARAITWRSYILPSDSTLVRFRERETEATQP